MALSQSDVVGSGVCSTHRGCGGDLVEVGTGTLHSITVAVFRCGRCGGVYDISDQVFDGFDEMEPSVVPE